MATWTARIALASALLLGVTACSWSQYGGSATRSGYQPFESVISTDTVSSLTRVRFDRSHGSREQPAIVNDSVYAPGSQMTVFPTGDSPFCTSDCLAYWASSAQSDPTPAVVDGIAYLQGFSTLRAYDAAGQRNCQPQFFTRLCTPLWQTIEVGVTAGAPAVVDGIVYIGGSRNLFAFDAAGIRNCSGTPKVCAPLWQSTDFGFSFTTIPTPTVANGVAYITSETSKLFAFDATGTRNCGTGTPKVCLPLWTAAGVASPPAVVGGVAYAVGTNAGLLAFDAAGRANCTGTFPVCKPLWSAASSVASGGQYPPAVANGVVHFVAGSHLYAMDAGGAMNCSGAPKTCAPLWSASDWSGHGPPTVANGVVYVGDTAVHAYDAAGGHACTGVPKTCTTLWNGPVAGAGHAYATPVVANGALYLSGDTGLEVFRPAAS